MDIIAGKVSNWFIRFLFIIGFVGVTDYVASSGCNYFTLSTENAGLFNSSEGITGSEGISPDSIKIFTLKLDSVLNLRFVSEANKIADSLAGIILRNPQTVSKDKIYPYYLIGVSKSLSGREMKSLEYFQTALDLLAGNPSDTLKGRILHFMGYTYNRIGDHFKSNYYFLSALELKKQLYGINSPELVTEYVSLTIANIHLRNYDNALDYSNLGLKIASTNPASVTPDELALLYQDKGVSLAQTSDYKQSGMNLVKAYEIYKQNKLPRDDNYVNLIDNIGSTYYYLEQPEKSLEYYKTGIADFNRIDSYVKFSLVHNYSLVLAEQQMVREGDSVLVSALGDIQSVFGENSREYYLALRSYAGYLSDFMNSQVKALELYNQCFTYVRNHPWDTNLNSDISLGYAMALMENDRLETALDSVRSLLYRAVGKKVPDDLFVNPDISESFSSRQLWSIMNTKFNILNRLYEKNGSLEVLKSAARTSELSVAVLERIRLNIGEEESRLFLGNQFRNSYMNTIKTYSNCYKLTHDDEFLEKAFEYSEKSKAASLLASTREMKALKYHVPDNLAEMERVLQREIGLYETRYSEETNRENPNVEKMNMWNTYLISATHRRDSLIKSFERNYPGYYSLKYNTQVIKTRNIPSIMGRDRNYISYIVSDTSLFIIVVNRKYRELITTRIDSGFYNAIIEYRRLLSEPDRNANAHREFELFTLTSYKLYSYLIKPVLQYLISDKIIISPDSILSFFPFETLVTDNTINEDPYYRNLPFLMNDYRISYAYSATLLSESVKTRPAFLNRSVSFAPTYNHQVFIDSLSASRQFSGTPLSDLKYAREEASFIAKLTSGKLFIDSAATESAFKSYSGSQDIIHLAMHTILNANDPVNSGMIFSASNELGEDNFLKAYEINSVPLNAKMVVLSSCYTGTGKLYAGEGVLSLARGFIFSGARSVVMSLWEVDDKSGTEIIEQFYKNLKAGYSKSEALRKARIKYLADADMLRSHPYFWSTLIIYGDDSRIYISRLTKTLLAVILILLIIYTWSYLRKR